jgi:hypothetical protein
VVLLLSKAYSEVYFFSPLYFSTRSKRNNGHSLPFAFLPRPKAYCSIDKKLNLLKYFVTLWGTQIHVSLGNGLMPNGQWLFPPPLSMPVTAHEGDCGKYGNKIFRVVEAKAPQAFAGFIRFLDNDFFVLALRLYSINRFWKYAIV